MRELRFHPSAPIEARYFYRYYAEISEALAEDFWRELVDAIEYAREYPERHHYDSIGLNHSAKQIRQMVMMNYSILCFTFLK